MRFAFLIPAITALGITGCQVPPAVTGTAPAPEISGVTPPATPPTTPPVTPAVTPPATPAPTILVTPAVPATPNTSPAVNQTASSAALPDTDIKAIVQDMDNAMAADGLSPDASDPPADDTPEVTSQQTITAGAAEDLTAETVNPDAGGTDGAAPATTDLALAVPPPPPPPPPPELAPQDLVGLNLLELQHRLGEADFTRREGAVETWQYRFQTCVVDYFIGAEISGPAVRSWAWRSPVIGGSLDATACRRELAGRDSAS